MQAVRAGGASSAHVPHVSRSVRAQVSLMCHFTAACLRCPPQHCCFSLTYRMYWWRCCQASQTGSSPGAAGSGCGGEDCRTRAAGERI